MTHRSETDIAILENVPLAPRTTLSVGGPARFYAEAHTAAAVRSALGWARERGIDVHVLGGGSNLLVADRGFAGLVLCVHIRGIDMYTSNGAVHVTVGAGEPWDGFVARAVGEGWAGVECLSGIPGLVGATPIQNVGAYGQEVADTIEHVEAIERATGDVMTFSAADCGFAYRDSAFKGAMAGRFVLTRVTFRLVPGGAPAIRYGELSRALAEHTSPSLAVVRETVVRLRRSKSMVYDAADENHRSAGSFFMNPIVDEATLARAREAAAGVLRPGETMPEFAAGPGRTKLAAGWLIERAGFKKGAGDGAVGLSTKHALAIVNRGGATAAQVVAFAARVRRGVRERFGVTLSPEPVLLGFEARETSELLGHE
ncbi:MAG: UDP-N-acetylmuramate dehydrogenase [Polyangiaceae bacterium]